MRTQPARARPWRRAALLLAALLAAAPLAAQTQPAANAGRPLSLDEALRLAEDASDQVVISQAGVSRARGTELQARSQRLPQVAGTAQYTRALASQFSGIGGGDDSTAAPTPVPANCDGSFTPNPANPLQTRVDSLEAALQCLQSANPFASLGSLPFGNRNTWQLGLNVNQNVFTGGRIVSQVRAAQAGRRTAEVQLASTRAQLLLDVTEAYFDAVLADRLVDIAEANLRQTETTLQQTRLARQVGNQPEFELLRAQVSYENQRPIVIQRRADRRLAYTRLALLLNLPPDQPLALGTPLNDAQVLPVARFSSNDRLLGDTTTENRAPVRQAAAAVEVQEAQVRIARAQRFPQLSVFSQYQRVGYPAGGVPTWDDFRTNWNVGAQLSVPIFTGGRIRGDQMVAEANLLEARARLASTRSLAQLDTRSALERLEAARATWEASQGTVEQATRAYGIAEIRYREGLSTQLELTDSRILLQQSEANRAQAARDLQIARARVALLADLPLDVGSDAGSAPQGAQEQLQLQQRQQQQQQQQQQAQPQTQNGGTGFTGTGVQ